MRSVSRVPLLLRALLFGSIVVGAGAPAAHAQTPSPPAADDRREIDARTAFARGDYREALSLYVKLYAETLHPTYLRNVGRCYQNLGEADKAISSFRDYLRKAKDLPPEKRQEIEGYIAEMEALKRQQAAGTAAAPAPSATQPPTHTEPPAGGVLPPALAPSDSTASAGAPGLQVETRAAPEPAPPLHRRWYFWAAIGTGLVVAAVAVAVAASGSAGPPRGGLGTVDLRMGGTP